MTQGDIPIRCSQGLVHPQGSIRTSRQSLLRLAFLLCDEEEPINGNLSSALPSFVDPALSDKSSSKRISVGPFAPTPPFALTLMLRFDLPGFPRRARPGALTKSVKLDIEDVGVCPMRPLPFGGGCAWELGARTGRR